MNDLCLLQVEAPVATLTLNRPEARNSLSVELLGAVHERVAELERREDVTVVVVTGAGKAFCAGMDLKAVLQPTGGGSADESALPLRLLESLSGLCLRLRQLRAVTLAKVNGAAIGGGCGLATVCDLAVTHADSKMGFPEVDLGVCPAVVAPWLVRKIGAGRARQVLLSGGTMSGQRAWELGIVNQVVPALADLDRAVDEIAGRLATGGPVATRATKALLNELDGSGDEALAKRGARLSAEVLATPEAQAMLRAKLGSKG